VTFPFETGTSLALVYALDDNMSPFWQLTAVVLVAVGVIAILTVPARVEGHRPMVGVLSQSADRVPFESVGLGISILARSLKKEIDSPHLDRVAFL
jgi:hypothetical protein